MKKVIALLCVVILLFIAGCSNTTPPDAGVTTTTSGNTTSQHTTESGTSTATHHSTTGVTTSVTSAITTGSTTVAPSTAYSTVTTTSTSQQPTSSTSQQPTASTQAQSSDDGIEYSLKEDGCLWVTGIGTCTLSDITIPGKVDGRTVAGIYASAFRSNTTIRSITLSEGITTIGQMAFANCSGLTAINLPSTLQRIENTAFSGCPIQTLTLPDGLSYIGNNAFNKVAITEVTIPGTVTLGSGVFKDCTSLKTVNFGEGITAIPSQAFMNCTALSAIRFPASITSYGTNAFYGCSNLTIQQLSLYDSVRTSIFNGIAIEHLDVYDNVPDNALTAAKLGTVTIHDGVTTIGKEAFAEAVVTKFELPASLSTVGAKAFYGCTAEEIVFEGAVSLGDSALRDCAVRSITLPAGSKVGLYAFSECDDLKTIRYGGTMAQWRQMIQIPNYGYLASDYADIDKATIVCSDGTIPPQTTTEPYRIRVATYNVGNFTGKNLAAGTAEANAAYRQLMAEIDADIWAFQEDVEYVNEDTKTTPYAAIYNLLPHHERCGLGAYNYKAYASKAEITEADMVYFQNLSSIGHKMFMRATVTVGDKEICLINVHLDWSDNTARREQIKQVIAYAKQYEYCIIAGDFNPDDYKNGVQQSERNLLVEEVKYFTDAGFISANAGEFGVVSTYVHKGGKAIDNILVTSNMRIENVGNLQTDWMNDHIPFWADIVIE